MKKFFTIFTLVFLLFTNLSFASPEANYWNDLKAVYEWDFMESSQEMTLKIEIPGQFSGNYLVNMTGKGNMNELISRIDMKITDIDGTMNFPNITIYTNGTDFYINTSAFQSFMSLMGVDLGVVEEDFIMIKNTQYPVDMNSDIIKEMLGFIEGMDLDIELGMVQNERTYELELDSDNLVDLLDSYMRYIISNMNNMPNSLMPSDFKISEEEIEQALLMYDQMITPNLAIAKEMIKGSSYSQVTVFEDGAYEEEAILNIVSPFVMAEMSILSNAQKSESGSVVLPTSVKVITEEELNSLMMPSGSLGNYLLIGLDGTYMHISNSQEITHGEMDIKNVDGFTFLSVNQISEILGVLIETQEEYIRTTELESLGFTVNWNSDNRTIEIY